MLPGMDGYTLLKNIRENEETRELPVIFIMAGTGQVSPGKLEEYKPDDYLLKPFSHEQLLIRIKNVLNGSKQKKEIDRLWEHRFLFDRDIVSLSGQAGQNILCSDSKYDSREKDIFIVEDNEELLIYLKENIQPLYNVFIARNGQDALDKLRNSRDTPAFLSPIL